MKRKNKDFERMTITIPKETKEKIVKIADKEMRTVSNMIAFMIEKWDE